MSSDLSSKELVPTVKDFAECRWKEALAEANRESDRQGYILRQLAFCKAAKRAIDEDRPLQGKVLTLLSDVCSMMLSPDSDNEPFKPDRGFRHSGGECSMIPDDLSETDLSFFAEIVGTIDDPWLKARLADLVWLRRHPPDVHFALDAVDAYRSIQLDGKILRHDVGRCWERAIRLARMLGKGAGDRLKEMEKKIIDSFRVAIREESNLAFDLANLLRVTNLGRSHGVEIASELESLANAVKDRWAPDGVRKFLEAASDWYRKVHDQTKTAEMQVKVAENLEKEAAFKEPLIAARFYEQAIHAYRNVPRSERMKYRVDEHLAELQARLAEVSKASLKEMKPLEIPDPDIGSLIKSACNAVRNKGPIEALKAFVNLHPGVNVKDLRETTKEQLQTRPISPFAQTIFTNQDGRVIAKDPGTSLGEPSHDDGETSIRLQMIRNHSLDVSLVVCGSISPALDVLLLEHRLQEADFTLLARESPIVPTGRERLFGKALFAGYDRDFGTALHILVPQIEHMVRFHLKQEGIKTTYLDHSGIETENSLNTLIDLPDTKKMFGENVSFEIRALFCEPVGPNLRNEIAHGLLDDESCHSVAAIYAWWYALKLVFDTFWNALHKDTKSNERVGQ